MPDSTVFGACAFEKADECMDEIGARGLQVRGVVAVRDGYPLLVGGAQAQVELGLSIASLYLINIY